MELALARRRRRSCVIARSVDRPAAHADLRGQVAVVTGGSRGLGLAIAREMAEAGCRLVRAAHDADELERARKDVQSAGGDVLVVRCDVTRQDEVNELLEKAIERLGRIDILVNNAGAMSIGPMETQTLEAF
jgi:NAD(P)-dependent dehydrogenase (short-subunit alcohol dehydrogenase family)